MVDKINNILTDILINKYKQSHIADKNNVSKPYVSKINTRLSQLKYKPKIVNNQIICLECGSKGRLVFHHNHNTGQPIAIICRICNHKIKNKTVFEDGELTDIFLDSYSMDAKKKGIHIDKIPEEVITVLKEHGINISGFVRMHLVAKYNELMKEVKK